MTNKDPHQLLIESARAGDMDSLNLAISLGADVNEIKSILPALHIAAVHGHGALVTRLLDAGADMNKPEGMHSSTALMMAAEYGNAEVMKLLIGRGAKVDQWDAYDAGLHVYAARTAKNADAVWQLLQDIGFHDAKSSARKMNSEMFDAAIAGILEGPYDTDPQVLAAMIRRGADLHQARFHRGSILCELMDGIDPDPANADNIRVQILENGEDQPLGDAPVRTQKMQIAEALKHTIAAGVSPFLEDRDHIYAYEEARKVPEFLQVFREACAQSIEDFKIFNPATHKLVGDDGKPTHLALYCVCEERLGEVLATARWENPRVLITAKQALRDALPERYRNKYAAELDTTALVRAVASQGNRLGHLGRPSNERDMGVR